VDPEPVGAGKMRLGVGATYSHETFYPLSGLEGDLLQVALLRMEFGISSIADFELSGGLRSALDHQSSARAARIARDRDGHHDACGR
jgi:hypothetical protein